MINKFIAIPIHTLQKNNTSITNQYYTSDYHDYSKLSIASIVMSCITMSIIIITVLYIFIKKYRNHRNYTQLP